MATEVYGVRNARLFATLLRGPRQCVKGDPTDTVPVPYHEPLENTSHVILQLQGPVSPTPESFSVNIISGSKGMKVPVTVRSTDTIGKMLQEVLNLKPDLVETLNLIYNGKPVLLKQTLCELKVKPGATFVTYQRCHGG